MQAQSVHSIWSDGDLFIPRYRPMRHGAWELRIAPFLLVPGYWSETVLMAETPALVRGNRAWMSIMPLELESQMIGIRAAFGHVLVFGLGMGWAAAATAARPEVTAVTVVERDPEVLELVSALDPFAQLPETARAKVRVIEGDAFAYRPDRAVDLLMPDIWLPMLEDGRLDEVRRMQANVGAAGIYFWTQELEIARHAVAAGRPLDDAGLAATVAELGLPLIGLDYPGYADKVVAVARRWMRDRWLPGSAAPW